MTPADLADARLAEALAAVASPVRLDILRQLRVPRTLTEIDIRTGPSAPGAPPRLMTRQAVREHLDRLVEIGAVSVREAERDRRSTMEYALNHQTLFAIAEEFRGLAALSPDREPEGVTVEGPPTRARPRIRGPCLVLVRGIGEGRTFPLFPPPQGSQRWVLGRSRGSAVALDFDPFVSTENAFVEWDGTAHALVDLPDSRNGTRLNFERLGHGERRLLATGDLIGVGRCLLLFRA